MASPWNGSISLLFAGTLFVTSQANAADLSVRALAARDVRVATIGYRLTTANDKTCERPQMLAGIVVHDLTQYNPNARAAVSTAFSLHGGFGVLGLVAGSPGDASGLQIDDEIIGVGSIRLDDEAAVRNSRQSYDREDDFLKIMERALGEGPQELTVRRKGAIVRLHLRGQPGCGGKILLADSSTLNAWSDGKNVAITTAMLDMARTDDEVAFVVAHEMAHNILGHASQKSPGFFGLFGIGISKAKKAEIEADAYSVTLMARAGYLPEGAIALLQTARRRLWWNISFDHPGFNRRIEIVTDAMARYGVMPAPKVATGVPNALATPVTVKSDSHKAGYVCAIHASTNSACGLQFEVATGKFRRALGGAARVIAPTVIITAERN